MKLKKIVVTGITQKDILKVMLEKYENGTLLY